jgi:hypothetical protein
MSLIFCTTGGRVGRPLIRRILFCISLLGSLVDVFKSLLFLLSPRVELFQKDLLELPHKGV